MGPEEFGLAPRGADRWVVRNTLGGVPRGGWPFCCNGHDVLGWPPMGAAIYLALVGGGLAIAAAISLVLRGVKLI